VPDYRILLGITGLAGAGKDAISDILVEDYGFEILRFSEALKEEILRRMPRTLQAIHYLHWGYGATPAGLRDLIYRTKPVGVRELLQEYGTEVRRQDDEDYWVRKWTARLAEAGPRIVCPDMRFPNEYAAIRARGGYTLRVLRPGTQDDPANHASENSLDKYPVDCQIGNIGSLTDLRGQIKPWAQDMGWG